jgi:hypothetical protein
LKILIENNDTNAHYYINKGLANAFNYVGHEVYLWNTWENCAFDVFNSFEPHIFIGNVHTLKVDIHKCIERRPHLKVIMKGPDFGPLSEIVAKEYPILYMNDEYLSSLKLLKEKTGKPDYVFVHYPEKYLKETHGYYDTLDIKYMSLLNAADIIEYSNGKFDDRLACDIGYIGGWWNYKANNLDPYITSLCSDFSRNIKIFGNSPWPCPQYCGFLPTEKVKDLFVSAKINLNVNEPHSQKYGFDVVERPFKVCMSGGFLISDYVEGLKDIFPAVPMGTTVDDFHNLIDYYITRPRDRKDISIECQKIALKNHTYFNRGKLILNNLGFRSPEFDNIIEKLR